MKKPAVKFPLYLGIFVFIITVISVSIKLGDRNILLSKRLFANQDEAKFKLDYSNPDIISITFNSTKEISGADLGLSFDKNNLEVLPSTLSGSSGYITTGGDLDTARGHFSFSAVNSDNLIKNGILATFKIKKLKDLPKINFVQSESHIFDLNSKEIKTAFIGLN